MMSFAMKSRASVSILALAIALGRLRHEIESRGAL